VLLLLEILVIVKNNYDIDYYMPQKNLMDTERVYKFISFESKMFLFSVRTNYFMRKANESIR
jgi:hypothetical protein